MNRIDLNPCECPGAGYCPRYRQDVNHRVHELCRDSPSYRQMFYRRFVTPAERPANQQAGFAAPVPIESPPPALSEPPKPIPTTGPGTMLKWLIKQAIGVDQSSACQCQAREQWMNMVGWKGFLSPLRRGRENRQTVYEFIKEEAKTLGVDMQADMFSLMVTAFKMWLKSTGAKR